MIYFLWTVLLVSEMAGSTPVLDIIHKYFFISNLTGLYVLSYFYTNLLYVYQIYSLWVFLWIFIPYLGNDIHQFFKINDDKKMITVSRICVITHIMGGLILGLLHLVGNGEIRYDDYLYWFSFFYFYNDIVYIIIYEFKRAHLIHHLVALGSFYLWMVYPEYGKDCMEALLILEKGNLLYTLWDWARNVGIKPKIGFCKYMTFHYIFVRIGYLSYKVITLIPRLYYDENLLFFHRFLGIIFTILVYIGSVWWSNRLYMGYQKMLFKTMFERSKLVIQKMEKNDTENNDEKEEYKTNKNE